MAPLDDALRIDASVVDPVEVEFQLHQVAGLIDKEIEEGLTPRAATLKFIGMVVIAEGDTGSMQLLQRGACPGDKLTVTGGATLTEWVRNTADGGKVAAECVMEIDLGCGGVGQLLPTAMGGDALQPVGVEHAPRLGRRNLR